MSNTKKIFISHVHEDDDLVPKLKSLIEGAGMNVRNGSVTSDKPNNAHNEEYIKRKILNPRIKWASTLVVLITHDTADSWWVNWEIKRAVEMGKNVIGVFAQGSSDADIPAELQRCGDAAIVGWQSARVVDAINGKIREWDKPDATGERGPIWQLNVHEC